MRLRLMTTEELLDLAATPTPGGAYEAVEAMLSLGGGCARSTHLFCFDRETPVKKRRWFDEYVNSCDAWANVSEARLLEMYGGVTWGVDEDQPAFKE